MRIAIIGSLATKVPPPGQGSVERLAAAQTAGLLRRGHTVTLFAPAGSRADSGVALIELGESNSWRLPDGRKPEEVYGAAFGLRQQMVNLTKLLALLRERQEEFEVVLNNCFNEAPLLATDEALRVPIFHVMHVPIIPQAAEVFAARKTRLVPISNAQRRAFPQLNYTATVYNGVDPAEFAFGSGEGNYLLYLGSIGKNKNPKDALLAARATGEKLLIGGRIKDYHYYEKEIKPLVDGKQIQWVGEIGAKEVVSLYQKAKAFLFPTLWEEPFGLVAIEALSCGTPVIAYPNGGLPEIIKDGVNGYLVSGLTQMIEKISQIKAIDRGACRQSVEEKFTLDHMVAKYEQVLQNI
ncbi:MAG: glycosyltransferase family 4 protein [Patescibacteria group bacterium]